jgi:cyclopropane fatty-acyl-phospholipid synthase-like methyltransferase
MRFLIRIQQVRIKLDQRLEGAKEGIMQEPLQTWESIFAREGLVFTNPHEDVAHLADLLHQRSAQTILDLGCGSGRHLLYFAQQHFTMYGIDAAPTGLALTRQQLEKAGLPHHYFTPEELHDLFKRFRITDLHLDQVHHYCVTAIKP